MACCSNYHCSSVAPLDAHYRRVLWVAHVLNGSMFLTEIFAGLAARSAPLSLWGAGQIVSHAWGKLKGSWAVAVVR